MCSLWQHICTCRALVFGEDVAFGGVFRCTVGLLERYGRSRVRSGAPRSAESSLQHKAHQGISLTLPTKRSSGGCCKPTATWCHLVPAEQLYPNSRDVVGRVHPCMQQSVRPNMSRCSIWVPLSSSCCLGNSQGSQQHSLLWQPACLHHHTLSTQHPPVHHITLSATPVHHMTLCC